MTIDIRSTATLSKSLAVKREKRDDSTEVVVCTLGLTDLFVDRDQLDELLSLPIGWSPAHCYDEGGAPLAPMSMTPHRGEWTASGVLSGGERPRSGGIKLNTADVSALVLDLTKLGALAALKLTWDAMGDEVEDLTELLGRECSVVLVLSDGGQGDLLRPAAWGNLHCRRAAAQPPESQP